MRQTLRKTLSALLALTMLLVMVPTLAGHTASADTTVTSVLVIDVDAPKAGASPDYDISFGPSDKVSYENINDGSWKRGVMWRDEDTGKGLAPTDSFLSGHQYTVIVSLIAKSGYNFGPSKSSISTKGTLNGNTASIIGYSTTNIGVKYTFPRLSTPAGFVSKVTVTGVTAPKAGEKPNFTWGLSPATVSSGGLLKWIDVTNGGWIVMDKDDRFLSGHQYTVIAPVNAKSGYCFGANYWDAASTATVNGNAATVSNYSATSIGVYYTFPKLATPSGFISQVKVTGVTAPVVGAKPAYSFTLNTAHTKKGTDGTSGGVSWVDTTGGGWALMDTSSTFQNGHTYTVIVYVTAESGYCFGANYWDMANTGTVNGKEAEISNVSATTTRLYYEFPTLNATKVSSVTITGIDNPAIGKTPDYDVTVSGTGCKKEDYNTSYWKNGVYWYDVTADEALEPTDKFVAGHQYRVSVSMISNEGYTFLNSDGSVGTTGKIGGYPAETYKYNATNVAFRYTFPTLSTPIASAVITGIDAPVAGKTPDYTASGSGTGYEVESDYNSGDWKNGVIWHDETDDRYMSPTDKFIAGHQYKVEVSLIAKSGYIFTWDSIATINGKAANLEQVYTIDNAGFSYTFPELPGADTLVSSVTITGVDAPVAGKKPDYEATVSGTGFELEDYNGTTWVHGVYWLDVTTDDAMKPDETFEAGHEYRVTFSLKLKTGYTFKNDSGEVVTPGTINGNTVTDTYAYSDGTVAYRYTFPKVEGTETPESPKTLIESVAITGLDILYVGNKPDYDVTAAGPGYGVEAYTSSAWKNGVHWRDVTEDKTVYPDDDEFKFKYNHVYRISVSIEPKEGYTFWNAGGDVVTKGTINGTEVTIVEDYGDGTVGFKLDIKPYLFPIDYVGFATYEGGLFLAEKGDVVTDANGLVQDPNHPETWYFCAGGQAQLFYTGLAEYGGEWFYTENGVCDITLTGLVEYNGGYFIVALGRLIKEYTGLIQDPGTGLWYFVVGGQVQAAYTGLVQYDGVWFYVINGRLATEYTGNVVYDGATFYVENGMVK